MGSDFEWQNFTVHGDWLWVTELHCTWELNSGDRIALYMGTDSAWQNFTEYEEHFDNLTNLHYVGNHSEWQFRTMWESPWLRRICGSASDDRCLMYLGLEGKSVLLGVLWCTREIASTIKCFEVSEEWLIAFGECEKNKFDWGISWKFSYCMSLKYLNFNCNVISTAFRVMV